jgi:predicted ATP-dependent serine protease
MPNPVCVCGTTKDVVHLVAICQHCDASACKPLSGCPKCAQYNAAVNNRVTAEHRAEKPNG